MSPRVFDRRMCERAGAWESQAGANPLPSTDGCAPADALPLGSGRRMASGEA
jgi:hypothetical protein